MVRSRRGGLSASRNTALEHVTTPLVAFLDDDAVADARWNVFGGCALYRSSLFDEIGGFRVELGRQVTGAAGCEETELCLRAAQRHPGGVFV